jgi:hypothetical protein
MSCMQLPRVAASSSLYMYMYNLYMPDVHTFQERACSHMHALHAMFKTDDVCSAVRLLNMHAAWFPTQPYGVIQARAAWRPHGS